MKTIEQILELTKNPYYKFTPEEMVMLNDFLLTQRATNSKTSLKTDSGKSSQKTRVTVRNIVKKVDTYPPESPDEL